MSYNEYWDQILTNTNEFHKLITSYWNDYSHMGTWQFWIVVSLLVLPLVLLFFTLDRNRLFEILFFGYTVHMLWTYANIPLERQGYFVHTYFLTPLLPFALNMTASALPVGYLLIYQYCTNQNKNFYLYTGILSAVFAFGFATVEKVVGLVTFAHGMNQLYLFLIDMIIAITAYWFTKFLLKCKEART
ncbi:hypothetical protein [Bacillus suaedae]|uniref:Uncharacterized protein n=1 Tax=Halalkalibacter suaedae TaxID=2822140 RepID=A0A940WTX0_9BACI|nr:hypothetical protein [Bacillus suaedae]MBP3952216.1 hypothetical protein [Bacillus suaedae]